MTELWSFWMAIFITLCLVYELVNDFRKNDK